MSNFEDTINVELLAAIADFHKTCPPITKGGEGFIRKAYRYATLDDINRIINPLLAAQGLFLTHIPTLDNTLVSIIYHTSGGRMVVQSAITIDPTQKNGAQAWGSALTYTKRYHTCAMLNLVTGDYADDGRDAQEEETPAELPMITAAQLSKAIEWISVDPGEDKDGKLIPLRRAEAFLGTYRINDGDLATLRSHEIKKRQAPPQQETVRDKAVKMLKDHGMTEASHQHLKEQETVITHSQPVQPTHAAAVPRTPPEDNRRVLTTDDPKWSALTAWLQNHPGKTTEAFDSKYIIDNETRALLRQYEAREGSIDVIPF